MKKIRIIFILLILIGSFLYLVYLEGTLPVVKNSNSTQIFVVRNGAGLNEIVDRLHKEELIRNKLVFYLIVKRLGIEKNIQAGDFRLSQSMGAADIAKALTHGTLDIWITIIEGLRKEEVAQLVSQKIGIPEVEFLKLTQEGFLFPDTYLIPKDATSKMVVDILSNNFKRRYSQDLREKANSRNLTELEVLTLASLVEKEARYDQDRGKVAGVLLRRLKEGIPLQIDATIQYALGYQEAEKSWWKKELANEDLLVDSSYNTYKKQGLPPGPIANPGLAAIRAVLVADENTPNLYYVSDSKGYLHFARTLEEHNQNIRRYLK